MRLLQLQLLLFAAPWVAEAIANKLLEDYERKLNKVNEKLDWRRSPGKHRLKRYRCIEEYVDEHGNVLEEGLNSFTTTPSPLNSGPMPRRKIKSHRMRGVKNTVIGVPGITTATKGLKVSFMKKKAKTNVDPRRKVKRRPLMADNETLMRVFPSTTTAAATAEIIEAEESADETILKNYFEPSFEVTLQRPIRVEPAKQTSETSSYGDTLLAPTPRTSPTDSSDISTRFSDSDISDNERRRGSFRRNRRLGRVAAYSRGSPDYDTNYDDYNYIDDEVPFVRRRIGRRRVRQYLAFPATMRYPGRRDVRFTKVAPSHYYGTPHPLDILPDLAVSTAPSPVLQKLRALSLAPPRDYQLIAPPTPLPLTPSPLAAPSPQPSPLPLAEPPSSQTIQMEDSTPETCRRMRNLATAFGITDISSYAQRNCRFLQTFAPGHTCEQIIHFVDSCYKKQFP